MRQIRIALAELASELHHLVKQALADQPDIVLVVVVSNEVTLLLEAERVDVVIVAMRGNKLPAVAERLVDEYPRLGVVCVDAEAGGGVVYRLRPSLAAMDEVSPRAIAAAIRSAAEDTTR
ncbi:MAG TPA: hypothetical protein VFR67_17445 [Pilimelia sp.]|nr:hypothetical protein [Pilimelia sp.]